MWNLAENIPLQRKDGHKEMKGGGQQDIHVPFPVWSTRCEPPLPPEGNSRNAFPRGRQVQLCQNPAALAPWVSHWLRMAGPCTLAWFGFSSLAGVMGKQHSHLSRAKIFIHSQKEKKNLSSEFVSRTLSAWRCGESS